MTLNQTNLKKEALNYLKKDLKKQNWSYKKKNNILNFQAPICVEKNKIRDNYSINRLKKLEENTDFINENLNNLIKNLATGEECLKSSIEPVFEICTTKEQLKLFKMCRFYWSSPYSDYVGRRIKIIIRDAALKNKPIIGIAALGSPLLNLAPRDQFLKWTLDSKKEKLNSCMDIYILGAMPPYNHLLCGKLIAYMLMSNEIRKIYTDKYSINEKKQELVCLFTTSLYGKSSIYNRIKYQNKLAYIPVGFTKGQGTFHISDKSFSLMKKYLEKENRYHSNNIIKGGSNWKFRVIRDFSRVSQVNENTLLTHGFKKEIYAIPLASGYKEYLTNSNPEFKPFDYPLNELVTFWKHRWLLKRKNYIESNPSLKKEIISFNPKNISIFYRIPKKDQP